MTTQEQIHRLTKLLDRTVAANQTQADIMRDMANHIVNLNKRLSDLEGVIWVQKGQKDQTISEERIREVW